MKNMRIVALVLIACATAACQPTAQNDARPISAKTENLGVPAWLKDHLEYMSRDGGRWRADNSNYMNENEVWDAYLLEFYPGPDNAAMTGLMFGEKNGERSKEPFWSFYQSWDPATGRAVVWQTGWGAVGRGQIWPTQQGRSFQMEQIFTPYNGEVFMQTHELEELSDTKHRTQSYNHGQDGELKPDREYIWVRQSIEP